MSSNLIDWLLERIGVVIFVVIFVVQIVRGLMKAKQDAPSEDAKPDALEEERRVQEIQAEIRRRIAERRGEAPPSAAPPPVAPRETEFPAPAPSPETTQMPEPFGGPMRRVLQEIERQRRLQQEPVAPPPLPPPVLVESRSAELVRQEQLAEQVRSLEETRLLVKRRAAKVAAADLAETRSESGQRSAARGRALDDLRDPESLRRAVVLREVLGTPVGLR